MEEPGELHLRGFIAAEMKACVLRQNLSGLQRLVVTSTGGFVSATIDIAEHLAPHRPHVIVRGLCLSSCANYLIPIASRLTVEPRSLIGLHGGVTNLVRKMREKGRTPPAAMLADAERERRFAAEFSINSDWFLPDAFLKAHQKEITNPMGYNLLFHDSQALAVGPGFLRSCLRDVEIDSFWYLYDHMDELKKRHHKADLFDRFLKRLRPLSSEKLLCNPLPEQGGED